MICGKCKRDLAALTDNGLCLQCSMALSKELKDAKLKFIKVIYDNNFNTTLIAELTGKPKTYIQDFINRNNLKRMNENKYTCTKCGNIVDQVYIKQDITGLCEKCLSKIKKLEKKEIELKLNIEPMATATYSNVPPDLKQKSISEIRTVEHIEPIKFKKPADLKLPEPKITIKKPGRPAKK